MCVKLFLGFCLSLLLPVLAPAAEQQYLVSESQLRNLETLQQRSEQDRQSWQQQAHILNQSSEALEQRLEVSEKRAETLNSQLRGERELTKKWQKSYEQSEISHTTEKSEMTAKIIRLETANKFKDKLLIAAGIVLFMIVAVPLAYKLLVKK
jgi:hypothetical protein